MPVFNFQKPDKVIMIDSSEFEGKFEFRPLEPGYGLTVGNALRRVLLSSLEGFAFTSVKIENIEHFKNTNFDFKTLNLTVDTIDDIEKTEYIARELKNKNQYNDLDEVIKLLIKQRKK